jgi:hypothetical protein
MSFFVKNNCLLPLKQTNKTNNILKQLYYNIKKGVSYIEELKAEKGPSFYSFTIEHITNVHQIPKPSTFPPNSFPPEIRTHINNHSIGLFTYTFHLFERKISILFLVEENVGNVIEKYNNYVDYMLVWLYIVHLYSPRGKCANRLKIFIYHTSLLKVLPISNIEILNETHINTAFTRTCPTNAEIVIYREEEWFKVFIHETFHNFGLDFSDMNNSSCNEKILRIFPVNSHVNLYESYTECWARIMNALFCSFIHMKDKNNVDEFLANAEWFIHFERIYSFFQMVKVLDFMSLTYPDLYKKNTLSENMRKTLYKENTSVLSYYVITLILINNYQYFLGWCNNNNITLLNFKKTSNNLDSFCTFIEKKYKTKNMLDSVECMEAFLNKMKKASRKSVYLLKNLRMTICELG